MRLMFRNDLGVYLPRDMILVDPNSDIYYIRFVALTCFPIAEIALRR